MTLKQFKERGKCKGCIFHKNNNCSFGWSDPKKENWELPKNCDNLGGNENEEES